LVFCASIVRVGLCLIRELAIRAQTFALPFPREASQIHLNRRVNASLGSAWLNRGDAVTL
jgi:hypothetical protein